ALVEVEQTLVVQAPGGERGGRLELHVEVEAAADERQADLDRMAVEEKEERPRQEAAPEVEEQAGARVFEPPQRAVGARRDQLPCRGLLGRGRDLLERWRHERRAA